ncbi:Signal recognition particle protein [Symmachiella dynata]|uniref:signal-recognition-particle GTPase n=1 Tax=Symmachiella dynata TaxID=2527995 RepID=A0A517ZJ01_9PLAN|nr:signal recognition particle receptor subunit alpha [Symmachiella dynata]QDU42413.1 Signal recognition particle protein [Symmachiella dynata]
MLESLTQSLADALKPLRWQSRFTQKDIADRLEAVRLALLKEDVADEVARILTDRIIDATICRQVRKSMDPWQQLLRVIYEELFKMMGQIGMQGVDAQSLNLRADGELSILLLCGQPGSGTTTTCGKLALKLKNNGYRLMLVAADLQNPAGVERMKAIGSQLDVPVYCEASRNDTVFDVCYKARRAARVAGNVDVLILDTSGRQHMDSKWISNFTRTKRHMRPRQVLYVCDATTSQAGVDTAKIIHDYHKLDGVILTKMDVDAHGGALLSMKHMTGMPIKFLGVGEQLDQFQEFDPHRIAKRMLGIVEKPSAAGETMRDGKFTLDTFLSTMKQMKKRGPMEEVMKMIPGMGAAVEAIGDMNPDDDMKQIEGIIQSMTPHERSNPDVIDISRRRRIAKGSGVDPADVNKLLKDFGGMQGMMSKMAGMSIRERMWEVKELGEYRLFNPDPPDEIEPEFDDDVENEKDDE